MTQIEPQDLHYYCDINTAIQAVQDLIVPGLAPADLDGVTELNHATQLHFSKEQLTKSSIKLAISLIFGHEQPKGDSPMIAAIRRWRETQRFTKAEEAEAVLMELSSKMVDQRFDELDAQLQMWRAACMHFHMLPLFEKPDNFAVWHRLGGNFSGVSMRFAVGEATSFEQLIKVRYSNLQPEVTSIKEQIGALLYNVKPHPERHLPEKFSNKAPMFRQENEWRAYRHIEPGTTSTPLFSFFGPELKAVYLGPTMHADSKTHFMALLESITPDVKIYQLRFAKGKLDLIADLMHSEA